MRSTAATYAARQLRVNCVAPGLVTTGQTHRFWADNQKVKVMTNPNL